MNVIKAFFDNTRLFPGTGYFVENGKVSYMGSFIKQFSSDKDAIRWVKQEETYKRRVKLIKIDPSLAVN